MTSISELPCNERFMPLLQETTDAFTENVTKSAETDAIITRDSITSTAAAFGSIAAISDMIIHSDLYPPDILSEVLHAKIPGIEGTLADRTTWQTLKTTHITHTAGIIATQAVQHRAPLPYEGIVTRNGTRSSSLAVARSILKDREMIQVWGSHKYGGHVPTAKFAAELCRNQAWSSKVRELSPQ